MKLLELFLSIIRHILIFSKKKNVHDICAVWRVNAVVRSVKVSSLVFFFKGPIPLCFKNKGVLIKIYSSFIYDIQIDFGSLLVVWKHQLYADKNVITIF